MKLVNEIIPISFIMNFVKLSAVSSKGELLPARLPTNLRAIGALPHPHHPPHPQQPPNSHIMATSTQTSTMIQDVIDQVTGKVDEETLMICKRIKEREVAKEKRVLRRAARLWKTCPGCDYWGADNWAGRHPSQDRHMENGGCLAVDQPDPDVSSSESEDGETTP